MQIVIAYEDFLCMKEERLAQLVVFCFIGDTVRLYGGLCDFDIGPATLRSARSELESGRGCNSSPVATGIISKNLRIQS